MAVSIGPNTFVGFGEESTAGTEVARSVWYRVSRCTLLAAAEYTEVNNLAHVADYATRGESIITRKKLAGAVAGFMSYRGMGVILKHSLGALATTGAGPTYTHTYTHALALPTSLTAEVIRGTSTNAEEFYGLRVSKLTIEVQANGLMTWEAELIGMGVGARAAGGTASLQTPYRIVGHHLGASGFAFNSVGYKAKKIKLVVDNKLTEVAELSSLYSGQPQRGDHADITIEVEMYATVETLYNAHLAGTVATWSAVFTEPTTSETFTITSQNATCTYCADPITAAGLVSTTATFRGHSSTGSSGITIEVVNSQSSGIAA